MSETTPDAPESLHETEGDVLDLAGSAHYGVDVQARRQAVDGAQMAATYTILTTALNSHGNAHRITESGDGQGLRLEKHQRNPLVLLQHGMAPLKFPQIGASVDPAGNYSVVKNRSRAVGTVYFEEANPDAAFIFAMVEGGRVFQMASIGFTAHRGRRLKPPMQSEMPDGVADLTRPQMGLLFTETMLHEWSVVDDGADPGAFKQMADSGWSLNDYKPTDRFRHWMQEVGREAPHTFGFGHGTAGPAVFELEVGDLKVRGSYEDVNRYMQSEQPDKAAVAGEAVTEREPFARVFQRVERIGQRIDEVLALVRAAEQTIHPNSAEARFGYCPQCGSPAEGYSRTFIGDRPAYIICEQGHSHPGTEFVAKPPSQQAADTPPPPDPCGEIPSGYAAEKNRVDGTDEPCSVVESQSLHEQAETPTGGQDDDQVIDCDRIAAAVTQGLRGDAEALDVAGIARRVCDGMAPLVEAVVGEARTAGKRLDRLTGRVD